MKVRLRLAVVTAVFGLLIALGLTYRADAQVGMDTSSPNPTMATGVFGPYNTGGLHQAKLPAQGVWAEIINVTPPWVVIQNQAGQEFPISVDQIGQFLVRWPYSTDSMTNRSVIEVTGPESASNTVIAEHIDVYEGADQNLVSPALNNLYGFNRSLTPFDVDQQQSYGTVYFMTPEEYNLPSRTHIVGNAIFDGSGAVKVSAGQNWYTIQPSANGMSVSQVTRGRINDAKAGDLVYLLPVGMAPKSLIVSQLVLYKKVPLNQFAR